MASIVRFRSLFALATATLSCAATPLRTVSEIEWLQQIEQQAIEEEGISPEVVHRALDAFVPNPRVLELDHRQPESTITFETYIRGALNPTRINKGEELLALYEPELASIEAATGVPPQVVVALWAVESSYGMNMGNFEVINSLATLAFEGRRADFFRKELLAALRILEFERMAPEDLKGSWAGAMGQCQFMPSVYLKHAVDQNGDGHRDIWNSDLDVMASIANYLASEGWQRGLGWGHKIDRTSADPASLITPDGDDGPAFEVTDNFRALLKWNRSKYFALSVGLLADEMKKD
ncbi:MAG: lytic murein transglycosylase [Alphaproteobacteria bacterium]|nr:lytic murein transglycosylase [Alphaproteobacteria bacterium]